LGLFGNLGEFGGLWGTFGGLLGVFWGTFWDFIVLLGSLGGLLLRHNMFSIIDLCLSLDLLYLIIFFSLGGFGGPWETVDECGGLSAI